MQMALATYATLFTLAAFANWRGLIAREAMLLMGAVVIVAHIGYYIAFRTGANLRRRSGHDHSTAAGRQSGQADPGCTMRPRRAPCS